MTRFFLLQLLHLFLVYIFFGGSFNSSLYSDVCMLHEIAEWWLRLTQKQRTLRVIIYIFCGGVDWGTEPDWVCLCINSMKWGPADFVGWVFGERFVELACVQLGVFAVCEANVNVSLVAEQKNATSESLAYHHNIMQATRCVEWWSRTPSWCVFVCTFCLLYITLCLFVPYETRGSLSIWCVRVCRCVSMCKYTLRDWVRYWFNTYTCRVGTELFAVIWSLCVWWTAPVESTPSYSHTIHIV